MVAGQKIDAGLAGEIGKYAADPKMQKLPFNVVVYTDLDSELGKLPEDASGFDVILAKQAAVKPLTDYLEAEGVTFGLSNSYESLTAELTIPQLTYLEKQPYVKRIGESAEPELF